VSALEVGILDSLAWRSEGEVRVALHLPTVETGGEVQVRFRTGNRRVRRPGTARAYPTGTMVEVSAPAQRLAGGTWRIAVRWGDNEAFTPLEARLLVRRGQPIALLAGPRPRTRMPEPLPRPAGGARHSLAARVVGRVRRQLSSRARRRPPQVSEGTRAAGGGSPQG
jgi:hypothetical protein